MHNPNHLSFFIHNNYIESLQELNIKIAKDKENPALYIKRAQIHIKYNNETSALSDFLMADILDKNNMTVIGTIMELYFNRGEFIKSKKYRSKLQTLEYQLKNNSCEKISIQNLLNKESYVPNL